MRRLMTVLAFMMLASGWVEAQEPLGCYRNSVKVSLLPTVQNYLPYISYERGLGKSLSLETDLYFQKAQMGFMEDGLMNSAGGKVGIKYMPWNYPDNTFVCYNALSLFLLWEVIKEVGHIGAGRVDRWEERMAMRKDGYLVSGIYLKTGLSYINQWRSYDCYVGFQDGAIVTEDRTYHGQQLGLDLILGNQSVGRRGFFYEEYFGCHLPLCEGGKVHNHYTPGFLYYFTGGIRLGWCF